MAQNVTIAGAQFPDVPALSIPLTGGGGNATFVDTSVSGSVPDGSRGTSYSAATQVHMTRFATTIATRPFLI